MMLRLARTLVAVVVLVVSGGGTAGAAEDSAQTSGPRYVAIGASDALGDGATDPRREGWVPRFAQSLGPDTLVTNLGVRATGIRQALADQLPAAVDADPDVVTIWLAVNDFNALVSPTSYARDLDFMLATLRQQTHARVLVGNIPDLTYVQNYAEIEPALLRFWVRYWNRTIARVAAQHGATLVDLEQFWAELAQNPGYVSPDGFHPSAAGYARLADVFRQAHAQPAPLPLLALPQP